MDKVSDLPALPPADLPRLARDYQAEVLRRGNPQHAAIGYAFGEVLLFIDLVRDWAFDEAARGAPSQCAPVWLKSIGLLHKLAAMDRLFAAHAGDPPAPSGQSE
jgi:hypothetical protein